MKEGHSRGGPVPEETGAGQAMCSEHSRNRRSSSFSVVWGLMTRNWASCAGASPANERLRTAVRQSAPGCHCRHSTMVPSHRQISETCRRWWMSRRSSSGRVISTSVARWGGDMMAGSNPQPPGPPVREPASRSDRARVPAAVRTAETSWIHRWRAAGRGLPRDVPRTGQAGHSGARAAETRSAARGGPVIGQCTARGSNSPRSSQWICQRTLGCRKRCSPRGSGVGSWKDRFARPWKRLRRETTRVGCATEGSPGLFKQEKMTHRAAGSRSGMEHAAWGTFSGRVSSGMRSKNPGNRFNKESIPGGDGLAAAFGDELLRQGPAGTCLSGSFTSRVRPRSRSGPNRGRDGRRRVDRRARRSAGSWHTRSGRRR